MKFCYRVLHLIRIAQQRQDEKDENQIGQISSQTRCTREYGTATLQGYAMPGHQVMELSTATVSEASTTPTPLVQGSYPTGMVAPVPAQPHFMIPVQFPRFTQDSNGSDQQQVEG
ncbi:hypothetical protein MKW98_025413 [Papaver atlanticum]|uniref:Uncharacterized protein n=1 Tax=Papaver atlanticum TaxID=357466 RepID=A0AAD4XCR2_9MAGN|nr:hypothetical protein MKW98_025413 [Papaver atlanticum]